MIPADTQITVLYGGVGPERKVSLASGAAVIKALRNSYRVAGIELRERALPPGLNPAEGIVLPMLHGEFGEDGRLQSLLEKGRFEYAGSDSISSALCMDKVATKERVAAKAGIRGAVSLVVENSESLNIPEVLDFLGEKMVLKPVAGGSSYSLSVLKGPTELREALDRLSRGRWVLEQFVEGREISVGVLAGLAQGIVEIIPEGGVYDYVHKYTPGATEYRWPAVMETGEESALRRQAEAAFSVCGCRDFARVDFRLSEDGPVFLEVNTLPGMTSESLLPKSADCMGLGFEELVLRMVGPALDRFQRRVRRIGVN